MDENRILFVDLDGTLIREDLSGLAFLHCLKKKPLKKGPLATLKKEP